VSSDFGRGPGI